MPAPLKIDPEWKWIMVTNKLWRRCFRENDMEVNERNG